VLIWGSYWIHGPKSLLNAGLFPAITLTLILASFAVRRQFTRLRWHSDFYFKPHSFLDLMTNPRNGTERWARKSLFMAALGVVPVCGCFGLAVTSAAALHQDAYVRLLMHPTSTGVALGVLTGSFAYLISCRVVPSVLMKRAIPDHRAGSWHVGRNGIIVRMPRSDASKRGEGAIGPQRSQQEELIRGYSETVTISFQMAIRAALESVLLMVVAFGILYIYRQTALPDFLELFVLCLIPSYGLAALNLQLHSKYQRLVSAWEYWSQLSWKGLELFPRWRSVIIFLLLFFLAQAFLPTELAFALAVWPFILFGRLWELAIDSFS
jgi:hypothetical protein